MNSTFVRRCLVLGTIISMQGVFAISLRAEGPVAGESSGTSSGMGSEKEIKEDAARMVLAPHTLMVETELLAALDQVKGLSDEQRYKIFEGNARNVYPRLDKLLTKREKTVSAQSA